MHTTTRFGGLILLVAIVFFGCDAHVEENIGVLQAAQHRLEANPDDDEALQIIVTLLKDSNGINRSNAAAVLGYAGERVGAALKNKALPPLIELLDKGDETDKQAAAKAIRRFGANSTEAIPVLRKYLSPPDTYLATMCAEALGRIGEPAAVAAPEILKVAEANAANVPEGQPTRREYPVRALGEIGPSAIAVAPRLLELIDQTDNPEFKATVAVAVMRIDATNVKAVSRIEELMRDRDTNVRISTMSELSEAGLYSRPALRVLKAAAESDSDPDVKGMAKDLLIRLNENN
jgi:HEAT repeat protein